jgi:hypothetical protein
MATTSLFAPSFTLHKICGPTCLTERTRVSRTRTLKNEDARHHAYETSNAAKRLLCRNGGSQPNLIKGDPETVLSRIAVPLGGGLQPSM